MPRILAALLLAAAPLAAAPLTPLSAASPDTMMLIGMPFGPESPQPVGPDHPLYHRVALAPIDGMPDRVNASMLMLSPGTKRSAIDDGLRRTLDQMNLLAPTDAEARVRLVPHWGALDAPVKISFGSHATATLRYTLVRLDTGAALFDREIVTQAEAHGGDGADRLVGTSRTALGTNFASAALCLDKAAYGRAPSDCALTPQFNYHAQSVAVPVFIPR